MVRGWTVLSSTGDSMGVRTSIVVGMTIMSRGLETSLDLVFYSSD